MPRARVAARGLFLYFTSKPAAAAPAFSETEAGFSQKSKKGDIGQKALVTTPPAAAGKKEKQQSAFAPLPDLSLTHSAGHFSAGCPSSSGIRRGWRRPCFAAVSSRCAITEGPDNALFRMVLKQMAKGLLPHLSPAPAARAAADPVSRCLYYSSARPPFLLFPS